MIGAAFGKCGEAQYLFPRAGKATEFGSVA
jgi:hypothetical protein